MCCRITWLLCLKASPNHDAPSPPTFPPRYVANRLLARCVCYYILHWRLHSPLIVVAISSLLLSLYSATSGVMLDYCVWLWMVQVVIITGSNTGVGYETAKALVNMGAHVIMGKKTIIIMGAAV